MPPTIRLMSLVGPSPVEITRVRLRLVSIGREQDNDVIVSSEGLSRHHACLLPAGSQWVLKDLQSTNGTWVNNVRLAPGQLKIIRNNDIIQLADVLLQALEEDEGAGLSRHDFPSLLVFLGENFQEEIVLSNLKPHIVIGGSDADLRVWSPAEEHLGRAIIRHNASQLELSIEAQGPKVMVNGVVVGGVTALSDRNEIIVEPFKMLVSFAPDVYQMREDAETKIGQSPFYGAEQHGAEMLYAERNLAGEPIMSAPQRPISLAEEDGWESAAARRRASASRKFIFGVPAKEDEISGTLSMEQEVFMHQAGLSGSSLRFAGRVRPEEWEASTRVQQRVTFFLGLLVFLGLLGLAIYALFSFLPQLNG